MSLFLPLGRSVQNVARPSAGRLWGGGCVPRRALRLGRSNLEWEGGCAPFVGGFRGACHGYLRTYINGGKVYVH